MKLNHLFIAFLLFPLCALAQNPDNIYADTAFAPFLYGVASGDPAKESVVLWTKVQPAGNETSIGLKWEIAADSNFSNVLNKGEVKATADADYTAKAFAKNLKPGQRYYYRFTTRDGKVSQTGKAQTMPDDSVKHFKLAVISCSSIWAGYFNAYRRISERNDVDFLVHLGDYVYDYPDDRQLNRMPADTQRDCASLADWRQRHTYYLLDPDLRAARQSKTWMVEWDNHDTDVEAPGKVEEAIQAFYEYLPIRITDEQHPERIYRNYRFGALADLTLIDMHLFRGKEEYEPGKKSVLGNVQDEWVKNHLKTSNTQWHLLGNQEMMTDWLSEGAPKFVKRGNGRVFDPSNWSGFPDDRNRFYDFISSNKLNNLVVLTGDIHMSFVMNMTPTPKDKTKYNRKTGEGAVGVEVTGPSVSRVNMVESGVPGLFIPMVKDVSRHLNPHHIWYQFTRHGYFTIDVTPEKCLAEFWYSGIKKKTDKEKFGRGYTVRNGKNHWDKKPNKKRKRSTYP